MGLRERSFLLAEIREGEISPLYLVHGPDQLLAAEVAGSLRERLGVASRMVDAWEELEKETGGVSLFPELLVARLSPPYPRHPRPLSNLPRPVVVAVEEELPSAHPLIRAAMSSQGRVIPAPLWGPEDLVSWLEEEARRRGKRLHPAGARRLLELEGSDRWRLVTELEKLVSYVGEREEITPGDVEEAGWGKEQASAWRVAELALQGRTGEGLRLLSGLLARGTDWGLILQALARELRLCLLLGEGGEASLPRAKAERLRRLFRQRGGRFWERAFSLLVETEKEAKRGSLSPEVALALLLSRWGELSSGLVCSGATSAVRRRSGG
jgi:DNA polymerase III delta subunit